MHLQPVSYSDIQQPTYLLYFVWARSKRKEYFYFHIVHLSACFKGSSCAAFAKCTVFPFGLNTVQSTQINHIAQTVNNVSTTKPTTHIF